MVVYSMDDCLATVVVWVGTFRTVAMAGVSLVFLSRIARLSVVLVLVVPVVAV